MDRFSGYWVAVNERRWWCSRGEVRELEGRSHERYPCFSLMRSGRCLPLPREREHRRQELHCYIDFPSYWFKSCESYHHTGAFQSGMSRFIEPSMLGAGHKELKDTTKQKWSSLASLGRERIWRWVSSRCSQTAPIKQVGFSQVWAGLLEASEEND